MRLSKPPVKRIQVTAKDMDTGKSRTTTLYETTPEEVIDSVVATAQQRTDASESSESAVRT